MNKETKNSIMTKNRLIENIERDDVWDSAKHNYADTLLEKYDSNEVRSYLVNKFKETGDYYYISIVKNKT